MDLARVLEIAGGRFPDAAGLIALCEAAGATFVLGTDGSPRIQVGDCPRPVAELIAEMLRREPLRSQVIEARGLRPPEPGPVPLDDARLDALAQYVWDHPPDAPVALVECELVSLDGQRWVGTGPGQMDAWIEQARAWEVRR